MYNIMSAIWVIESTRVRISAEWLTLSRSQTVQTKRSFFLVFHLGQVLMDGATSQ